ncbi:MAG: hypothetical protein ACE5HB_07270, partial [Terriglobia bacterium]
MPFAGFENFEACVAAQIKRGESEESARAICGRLQAEAERGSTAMLEGKEIEIFKAGDYGDKGKWSLNDLERMARDYSPRVHAAPVVLGHPENDSPAFGWVSKLRRVGESLWATLEKVQPAFTQAVKDGRFTQRSVALYPKFELTGGPYLRHLGFLGAAIPQIKGLEPIRFQHETRETEHIEIPVTLEEQMNKDKETPNPAGSGPAPSKAEGEKKEGADQTQLSQEHVGLLTRFAEGLRNLFNPDRSGKPADQPAFSEEEIEKRVRA